MSLVGLGRQIRQTCRSLQVQSVALFATTQQRHTSIGQPHPLTHPHLLRIGEVTPFITCEEYKWRRDVFASVLPENSVAVVLGNQLQRSTNDIDHVFQQNADVFYLSGFLEPNAALIFDNRGGGGYEFSMVVQKKDPSRELWDGARSGIEGACSVFGATKAHESLSQAWASLGLQQSSAATTTPKSNVFVNSASNWLDAVGVVQTWTSDASLTRVLDQMRVVKSNNEIAVMQRAANIASNAFNKVMINAEKVPDTELGLQALYEFHSKCGGSHVTSFPCVVAQGSNATTLHYIANTQRLSAGNLVLVDAGSIYGGYCSDISRTFPACRGKFSVAQKALYSVVLETQKTCIQAAVAGSTMHQLHQLSSLTLAQGLVSLGIVPSSSTTSNRSPLPHEVLTRFYPHSIGHFLGIDLHDTPSISPHTPLQENMVITIEPGLYIPDSPDIPKEFRNIGIRIEDDIVISADGKPPHVLTNPFKDISDVEAATQFGLFASK
eukprot:c12328_g1_i2.p1 GENE.c12328_g1_i2~~c12328_g1_i2.p1  ORF type:complete len:494 (-),score=120.84 c12328_g1_i2:141-1622(-)